MIKEHKKVLDKLCSLIEAEKQCAILIDPENESICRDLDSVKKTADDKFVVLVMGIFSSGKSSMINALIGEPLLPTGFLPETGVLCEMHYGTEKRITMYPKPGAWPTGDMPFELPEPSTEQIAKYASIDNEAGINAMRTGFRPEIDSKFEKMIIHWPLEILKDGVVLVDSPGINDPWSNDYITRSYLPKADAIIYLMNSQHAYSLDDANQLDEINCMNIRDIIVGYTYFDRVVMQTPEAVDKMKWVLNAHAKNHTDLGEDAVHFLSSLDGLRAKLDGKRDQLIASGYDDFEKYLAKYLVERKGIVQVNGMYNKLRHYSDLLRQEAKTRNAAASIDMETLQKRIEAARAQIRSAKRESDAILREFEVDLKSGKLDLDRKIEKFVPTLAAQVDLEDFEPKTILPRGFENLNPVAKNRKATQLKDEFMEEYTRRLKKVQNKWVSGSLAKDLTEIQKNCIQRNTPELERLAHKLNDIDLILTDGVVQGKGSGTVASIALSVAYTVLTNDWYTGAMGAVYGKETIVKRFGYQLAAGALLAAVGAPITLPVLAVTAIVTDIIMILTTNQTRQSAKIKKSVVTRSREAYDNDKAGQAKNAEALKRSVEENMHELYNRMKEALAEDIKAKEALIQKTIDDASKEQGEKSAGILARNEACKRLDELIADAADVTANYRE